MLNKHLNKIRSVNVCKNLQNHKRVVCLTNTAGTNAVNAKIEEKFIHEIRNNQLDTYKNFYENQFYSKYNKEVIVKIVQCLNGLIKNLNKNSKNIDDLKKIKQHGDNLLQAPMMNNKDVLSFVIEYIETIYSILKLYDHDNKLTNTYHTQFTKGFMDKLYEIGNNTQLFFTFENVDDDYLIDIRPVCIYLNYLLKLPDSIFSNDCLNMEIIHKEAEGNMLDFRELTFHDMGHSYVMSRQDTYLFSLLNKNPVDLVEEWINNKNWFKIQCDELLKTNNDLLKADNDLYQAVKLYLFDIIHDRGYQFYLPIMRQQFRANKNLENIKTKLIRGNFSGTVHPDFHEVILNNIDRAQEWWLNKIEQRMITDNLEKIDKYGDNGYIIRRFPDVENHSGVPKYISIRPKGDIRVYFEGVDGIIRDTSLYEIELLSAPADDNILSNDKVTEINKGIDKINGTEDGHIVIDTNANVKLFDAEYVKLYPEYHLKPIEIYKLKRVLQIAKNESNVRFSITKSPIMYETNTLRLNGNVSVARVTIDNGLAFKLWEVDIDRCPSDSLKYINMDSHKRFVKTKDLRKAYIRYYVGTETYDPYVTIKDSNGNEYELGIVDTQNNPEIAKAISSILTRSIDRAKDIYGGYIPEKICERAQLEYVSPYAVSNLWGRFGYRFVLSRKVDEYTTEIIGTALIAYSKDNLFFFTNKYNNVKVSTMNQDIDFDMIIDGDSEHRWFDKFAMPPIELYKPPFLNQIANFAIERLNHRGTGLGKMLIDEIIRNYAIHNRHFKRTHSQPLICGKGLFQIADPSWLKVMTNIGFKLRLGAETFYLDQEWDRLPQLINNGKAITNIEYNNTYGLPQLYDNATILKERNMLNVTDIDLVDRIPEVIELSKSGKAKLQYFQLVRMFDVDTVNRE